MIANAIPRLPVDFGNADQDGAIWLVTRGTVDTLRAAGMQLCEGAEILLTDGEINARGIVSMRAGMWVAVVSEWLADTEPSTDISW